MIEDTKVDMCSCKPGDILISKHGERLVYIKHQPEEYFPHVVKYSDGSHGSRTDEGWVGKKNRFDEDHDIVKIEPISKWESFLFQLTEDDLKQIITDHEQFSKAGVIGDCLLQQKAREYIKGLGVGLPVISIMRDLAFESYKHFATKYFTYEESQRGWL